MWHVLQWEKVYYADFVEFFASSYLQGESTFIRMDLSQSRRAKRSQVREEIIFFLSKVAIPHVWFMIVYHDTLLTISAPNQPSFSGWLGKSQIFLTPPQHGREFPRVDFNGQTSSASLCRVRGHTDQTGSRGRPVLPVPELLLWTRSYARHFSYMGKEN